MNTFSGKHLQIRILWNWLHNTN